MKRMWVEFGDKIKALLFKPTEARIGLAIIHGFPLVAKPVWEKGYDELAEKIAENNIATLIFNMRGLGGQTGEFSLKSWIEDAINAISWLKQRYEHIALLGFSLGGFTAINAAAQNPVDYLISVSAPAKRIWNPKTLKVVLSWTKRKGILNIGDPEKSAENMIKIQEQFNPTKSIKLISPGMVTIIHGDGDKLVPVENAYRLYSAARNPKKLIILGGYPHRLRSHPKAIKVILSEVKLMVEELNG